MANVSKLVFGAAIAVASISTPASAAHKIISAHHYGYVTRSSQGRGVYNFVPVAPSVYRSGVLPPEQQCSGNCDPYGHSITANGT